MKKTTAVLCAALFAANAIAPMNASSAAVSPVISEQRVSAADTTGYAIQVVKLVNQERAKKGLKELKLLPKLSSASEIRVKETARVWDHNRPNGSSFSTVFNDVGLKWSSIAENIAYGQWDPTSVMNSWMNSDSHRKSILNSDYQYIGVGVYESNGVIYWEQLFLGSNQSFSDSYTAKEYGDVNSDGKLDAVDASLVLAEYANSMSGTGGRFSQLQRAKADVSFDSVVDAVDASRILSMYAKNSTR